MFLALTYVKFLDLFLANILCFSSQKVSKILTLLAILTTAPKIRFLIT